MEREQATLPLLSIVIPTRNRIPYAISSIKSILRIPSGEFELVVQDNSDTRELETFVGSLTGEARLRYNYTPPPFSSIDNFNKAVELASGEYVCIIGDDDSVAPELVSAAHWAKTNNIDAIRTNVVAYYLWPDVQLDISRRQLLGRLTILPFFGKAMQIDAEKALHKLVRNAGQDYLNIPVPKIYHGLVKRDCLIEVYKRTGAYFKGLSPDMFGAITLACVTLRVISVDYPLTLPGTSVASTAGDSAARQHKGRLEDAPHFRDRPDYHWSELIPRFYSVQTIWAETAVVALQEMNRFDLLERFNLPLLAAHCLFAHREYAGFVLRDLRRVFRETNRNPLVGYCQLAQSLLLYQIRRVYRGVLRRLRVRYAKPAEHVDDLNNIEEASQALAAYLTANNLHFEDCVKNIRL
jgi:glycosyltransferase involved in cell wall biosynthesis